MTLTPGPVVESPADTEERAEGESSGDFTDRIQRLGAALGIRRQCSIGWHYECSDPAGEECRCACHPKRVATRALPLPDEPGAYMDQFGDVWKLEQDGVWWLGRDDEADPRDGAPLLRLEPLSDKNTQFEQILTGHVQALKDARRTTAKAVLDRVMEIGIPNDGLGVIRAAIRDDVAQIANDFGVEL